MTTKDILLKRILDILERNKLEEIVVERIHIEHEVRKRKRLGMPCPHISNNLCTQTRIRCGDRNESAPEGPVCNYNPQLFPERTAILVVDDDALLLEICRNFLLINDFSEDQLFFADGFDSAMQILKDAKKKGACFYIIVSDIRMQKKNGFDLVNEIILRNISASIILMSGYYDAHEKPEDYLGDLEISPGEPIVNGFLRKPFLQKDFIGHIQQVKKKLEALKDSAL